MAKPQEKDEEQLKLEEEVKRLRRNIMQNVRRAKKRGYTFSDNYVPKLPQSITEGTLRKFQKYTSEHMYKHSVYVSTEGIKKEGVERKKEENVIRSQRSAETRKQHYQEQEIPNGEKPKVASSEPAPMQEVLLMNIEDLIWQIEFSWYDRSRLWTHSQGRRPLKDYKTDDASYMKAALETAIQTDGEQAVLERINANATTIYAILDQVLLGSGDKYHLESRDGVINSQVQKFAAIVKGSPITASESLLLTDMAEKQQGVLRVQ